MDFGSMLSSFGFANGTNNNSIIWIIIIAIVIFFGKPGFGIGGLGGLGGNVPVTGVGACCCDKHHHHSKCYCRGGIQAGINPAGLGGFGGYEWLFIILILALVFLLNNENRTQVEC